MRALRNRIFILLAPALLLLLTAAPPLAAQYDNPDPGGGGGDAGSDHVVQVRDNFFDPAEITIQEGDTVTWRWEGPSNSHNVREDNDGFRCANGCDGFGGNGDVSTGWEFSLEFTEAGTVNYYCELHGAPGGIGMAGTVTVQSNGGGGDGDPGTLSFATSSYVAGEGDGSTPARVERTGGTSGSVSVTVTTSNGSATAGQDYTAIMETLSWGDGDGSTKSVSIPILDDSSPEGDESFTVSLSGATGGATIGSPSSSTVTIRDDDEAPQEPGTLSFETASAGVLEESAQARVPVVRTGGTAGSVSADFETSGGTATAGADYEETMGTVMFGEGEDRKTITVPILQDSSMEPTETIQISLTGAGGGASLGAIQSATLFVFDGDETQASLTAQEAACDAFRLQGLLDRTALETPGSDQTPAVNLSFTQRGDFAGIAYTANGPTPEAHLAFSTNPEETTLLRNPDRPQLFAVSLTRNQTNSDLVEVGSTDHLALLLNPTLDTQNPNPDALLEINDVGDPVTREGGTPAQSKPGRGLNELVQTCHGKFTSRDQHVFQVLSKIARAEMAGAAAVKIGIFRGQDPDTYRLDATFVAADGSSMGRLAAELEIAFGPGEALEGGTLRLLGACTPDVSTGCTSVDGMARLQLVRPTFGDELWEDTAYFVSTGDGGQSSASVDLADLLSETTWLGPL